MKPENPLDAEQVIPFNYCLNQIMKFLLLALLSCSLPNLSYADRFYVSDDASPGGDGSSWGSAFQYVQDALDQTVAGRDDEVWIEAGTYYPDDGANVTEGDRTAMVAPLRKAKSAVAAISIPGITLAMG
jgi:hypothetical protein